MSSDVGGRGSAKGFSAIELVVTCAIMLCIAALSVPSVMEIVATSQMRSTMSELGSLLQASRSTAIRKNEFTSVHFSTVSTRPVAFIKRASDGVSLSSTDPQNWFPSGFAKAASPSNGAPELDPSIMWNGLTSDPLQKSDPTFNPRGLPCLYDSTKGTCAPNFGFIFYFSYTAPVGRTRWAALGISPAGRVKSWYWTGTKWSD